MELGPDAVDALITGGTGLLGALIGALVALLSARRAATATLLAAERQVQTAINSARDQARASLIGSSRQKWIDDLRTDIAQLIAALFRIESALAEQTHDGRQRFEAELSDAHRLEAQIAMRLNPDTPTAAEDRLLLAVNQAVVRLQAGKRHPEQLRHDMSEITESARGLLKEEWERQWDLVGGKQKAVVPVR